MKRYLISFLFLFAIISCGKNTHQKILNQTNLSPQLFSIDINKDTVLKTTDGCIVQIPAGSLSSDKNPVKLELKEAITNEEIVLAGLNTMSGRAALSSGGMIYINAANGYNVTIKKQFNILVPTNVYNRNMNVYEGKEDTEGKINWTNPTPLPIDETTTILDAGKDIFIRNCSACHAINKDLTAPALYGITNRKNKAWISDYTQFHSFYRTDTPTRVFGDAFNKSDEQLNLNEFEIYHRCMQEKYNHLSAPYFHFTGEEMEAFYSYVKNETDNRPDLKDSLKGNCCDSCIQYNIALQQIQSDIVKLTNERNNLIKENENNFSLKREIPGNSIPNNVSNSPKESKVIPINKPAVYYTINVKAIGWYNIDILMKDLNNCKESELMVRIQGNYQQDFNVTLSIPSIKAFISGGKLNNSTDYGFDENNGIINLPQAAKCVLMAYAEKDNAILYGTASFNATTKQLITIIVKEIPKDQLKKEIENLGLSGISGEANDSKNAEEIRKSERSLKELDKKRNEIELLKPKNCSCSFLVRDSSKKMEIEIVDHSK